MKSVYVLLASRNNKSPNAFLIDQATSLDCYQCTSAEELSCGDSKVVLSSLRPANCNHVYDARYCIQSIGRYGGSYNLVWTFSVFRVFIKPFVFTAQWFCILRALKKEAITVTVSSLRLQRDLSILTSPVDKVAIQQPSHGFLAQLHASLCVSRCFLRSHAFAWCLKIWKRRQHCSLYMLS